MRLSLISRNYSLVQKVDICQVWCEKWYMLFPLFRTLFLLLFSHYPLKISNEHDFWKAKTENNLVLPVQIAYVAISHVINSFICTHTVLSIRRYGTVKDRMFYCQKFILESHNRKKMKSKCSSFVVIRYIIRVFVFVP